LEEIITNYKNLGSIAINLNMLFDMSKRDELLERLSKIQLKSNIKIIHINNTDLEPRSIETLTKNTFL